MLLVSDAHAHVSPLGLGAKVVAKRFKEAGGWFIALVSLPPNHYGFSAGLEGIIKAFESHVIECGRAREEGIRVACLAGIHPAYVDELVRIAGSHRTDKVLGIMEGALEHLKRLKIEGKIDGLGEFGRPHYKTLPESVVVNEIILVKALEICRDTNTIIHLHTEQGGLATVASVDYLVRLTNAPRNKVVFHHASTYLAKTIDEFRYVMTVLGREDLLTNVLESGVTRALVESDFIDDPRRPGVVMYPWDVSEEVKKLLSRKKDYEEALMKYLIDNVVSLYGVPPP
ncbi:MAG: TatD family hydrolase [Desulfurococcaceae archaeon TW002]